MKSSAAQLDLSGLVSAPHTPFAADGSLAVGVVPAQAEWLASSGVVGAFVGGTTGEWPMLTVEERCRLFEAWAEHRGPLRVIAHVGHLCQQDAIRMAQHAAGCGLDAVSALAPCFFRPGSAAEVAAFFAPIAAAAPELPFYLYHLPGMTGIQVPPDAQIAACLETIPTMAGVKFTDPDLYAFGRCMAAFGDRCELVWGVDEVLLGALGFGVKAAVGSTYNYAAPLYAAMMAAHDRGDRETAAALGLKAAQLVEVLIEFGVLRAGKALMKQRGVDCGPPRPPVTPLTADEEARLFARVDALGVLGSIEAA